MPNPAFVRTRCARRTKLRYASIVAASAFMKQVLRLAIVAPMLFLAACGLPYWYASTFDQFPVNRGRAEKGGLIKVVALMPGGGVVGDAIGTELAKRGFVISPPASTMSMVTGVDLKIVYETYMLAGRPSGEMEKLRNQLRTQGVDAFLVVRADRFNPRQFQKYAYFQQANYAIYSTQGGTLHPSGEIYSGGWGNIDDRPKSPSEAAVEIVNRMATHTGP